MAGFRMSEQSGIGRSISRIGPHRNRRLEPTYPGPHFGALQVNSQSLQRNQSWVNQI